MFSSHNRTKLLSPTFIYKGPSRENSSAGLFAMGACESSILFTFIYVKAASGREAI